jgi:hypothetical protein
MNDDVSNANPVETRMGQDTVTSIELGMGGAEKPTAKTQVSAGTTAEFDGSKVNIHEGDNHDGNGTEGAQANEGGEEAGNEGGQEGGGGAQLPKFEESNADVVSQYEAAYINPETGEPNVDALSQSWFKNASKDANGNWTGSLSDDDYAFLETKGYSKGMVKQIEQGQVALLQQQEQAIYSRAGGADKLQQALEWARKGGYSDEQKRRYNEVVVHRKGGADDRNDQIDLLMQRYSTATRKPGPQTRPTPRRSVTNNAGTATGQTGGSGEQGYKDHAEWRKALAAAKDKPAELETVRRKLKASSWYGQNG